jgi:hypothetical protein
MSKSEEDYSDDAFEDDDDSTPIENVGSIHPSESNVITPEFNSRESEGSIDGVNWKKECEFSDYSGTRPHVQKNKYPSPGDPESAHKRGNSSENKILEESLPFLRLSQSAPFILKQPTRHNLFNANGPCLPPVVTSTAELLNQRNSSQQQVDTIADCRVAPAAKKRQKRFSQSMSKSSLDNKVSMAMSFPSLCFSKQRVPTHILAGYAANAIGQDWNEISPELVIDEFYKRILACTTSRRLRTRDIFEILDDDGDSIIGINDMLRSFRALKLKMKQRHVERYLRNFHVSSTNDTTKQFRFRGQRTLGLDFLTFKQEMSSRNLVEQSRVSSRMRTYSRRHAKLLSRIRTKRDRTICFDKTNDPLDVTSVLKDKDAAVFWKISFGPGCGIVSGKQFIFSFRKYVDAARKEQARHDLNRGSPQAGHGIPSPKSGKKTNEWVFERVQRFMENNYGMVSVSSFADLLRVYGPMDDLLDNIIVGKFQSKQQLRIRKQRDTSQKMLFSTRTKTFVRNIPL